MCCCARGQGWGGGEGGGGEDRPGPAASRSGKIAAALPLAGIRELPGERVSTCSAKKNTWASLRA